MKASKISALAVALVMLGASGSAFASSRHMEASRASISKTAVDHLGNRPQHAPSVHRYFTAAKISVVGNRPQHAAPARAEFALNSAADEVRQRDPGAEQAQSYASAESREKI